MKRCWNRQCHVRSVDLNAVLFLKGTILHIICNICHTNRQEYETRGNCKHQHYLYLNGYHRRHWINERPNKRISQNSERPFSKKSQSSYPGMVMKNWSVKTQSWTDNNTNLKPSMNPDPNANLDLVWSFLIERLWKKANGPSIWIYPKIGYSLVQSVIGTVILI